MAEPHQMNPTEPVADPGRLVLREYLPIALTNRNTGRGHAWFGAKDDRKFIEGVLRCEFGTRRPFDYPVRLQITRILLPGQRLWDFDSVLRGNAKEIIDSLVALGWFVDDGPKWICGVIGEQDGHNRQFAAEFNNGDGVTLIEVYRVAI